MRASKLTFRGGEIFETASQAETEAMDDIMRTVEFVV